MGRVRQLSPLSCKVLPPGSGGRVREASPSSILRLLTEHPGGASHHTCRSSDASDPSVSTDYSHPGRQRTPRNRTCLRCAVHSPPRRYGIRRDGKDSAEVLEATASQITERIGRWLVAKSQAVACSDNATYRFASSQTAPIGRSPKRRCVGRCHRGAQAGYASTHRWGRPTQRTATCLPAPVAITGRTK